jgi:dihydroorotate dehydrogenase electron transfer subunit
MVIKKTRLQRSPSPAEDITAVDDWNSSAGRFPSGSLAAILSAETEPNDVVLDPLSNRGETAVEILRGGRRAALIELNPVSAFFAEVLLRPVSLPRLQWGFDGIRAAYQEETEDWYATRCRKCGHSGRIEAVEYAGVKAVRIEYACACSRRRLAKKPDAGDLRALERWAARDIPFWQPSSLPTDPPNRRTTAALSVILNAIDNLTESSTHAALRAAFAAALKYRLPAEPRSKEYNPWAAFEECYRRLYELKAETNRTLPRVTVGRSFDELAAGRANAVILGRNAEVASPGIPDGSVDGMVTIFPGAGPSRSLTELQAAWLKIDPAGLGDGSRREQRDRVLAAFHAARRALKTEGWGRVICPDREESDFHGLLRALEESGLPADRIRHRPDPASRGYSGGYEVSIHTGRPEDSVRDRPPESLLREKLSAAARTRLVLHGANATAANALRAFYQQLDGPEISAVANFSIQDFLAGAVEPFARIRNGKIALRKPKLRGSEKTVSPASARRAVLDAELFAVGDDAASRGAWENAVWHFSNGKLTPEDASRIRKSLRPAEVSRHLWNRTGGLLRAWGRALGYSAGLSKDAGIRWKTSAGKTYEFSPAGREIRIRSRSKSGAVEWGFLPLLDLERNLSDRCLRRPELNREFSGLLHPMELFPEDTGDTQSRPSPVRDHTVSVLDNRKICDAHYLMTVEWPKDAAANFLPGQFFHVVCDPTADGARGYPLTLRRPFSVHRVRYPGFDPAALTGAEDLPEEIRGSLARRPSRIEFLYRVVGEGTELLSRARKGTALKAIGPCGNGFPIGDERTAVIVAGGIGIAPLAALAERLRSRGKEVLVYVGATVRDMLNLAVTRGGSETGERDLQAAIEKEFREIGAKVLTVCTDDGSAGEKGLVTEMLDAGIRGGCVPRESVCLYACGPEGMLRATARIAEQHGLECVVSLEERMACGIGACYSCTVSVRQADGTPAKKRVCREGPVFNARDILWKD